MTHRTRALLAMLIGSDERRRFTLDELRPIHEYLCHVAGREYALDPTWQARRELGLRMAGLVRE